MPPPQRGQLRLCKVSALASRTRAASRLIFLSAISLVPIRFQVVLEPQKSLRDSHHKHFFSIQVGDSFPSSVAAILGAQPKAMVHLFVDNRVEQFSAVYQSTSTNGCITRNAGLFKGSAAVGLEAARIARRVGQSHIRKRRVRFDDEIDPCLRMLVSPSATKVRPTFQSAALVSQNLELL
jgi:hypothetical protein